MKKIIALLVAAILIIALASVAFARPVAKCPECNGEFRSTKVIEDWKTTSIGTCTIHWEKDHWDGHYTQTRKVANVCSNGTHAAHTETRQRTTCNVNPATWGWAAILH